MQLLFKFYQSEYFTSQNILPVRIFYQSDYFTSQTILPVRIQSDYFTSQTILPVRLFWCKHPLSRMQIYV